MSNFHKKTSSKKPSYYFFFKALFPLVLAGSNKKQQNFSPFCAGEQSKDKHEIFLQKRILTLCGELGKHLKV